jgi:hypothetical protein
VPATSMGRTGSCATAGGSAMPGIGLTAGRSSVVAFCERNTHGTTRAAAPEQTATSTRRPCVAILATGDRRASSDARDAVARGPAVSAIPLALPQIREVRAPSPVANCVADTGGFGATSTSVDRTTPFFRRSCGAGGWRRSPRSEAARWLDEAAVLKDSDSRPGLPLRKLLRAGRIEGGVQRPPTSHGRCFIERVHGPGGRSRSPSPRTKAPANRKPRSDAGATTEAAAARSA